MAGGSKPKLPKIKGAAGAAARKAAGGAKAAAFNNKRNPPPPPASSSSKPFAGRKPFGKPNGKPTASSGKGKPLNFMDGDSDDSGYDEAPLGDDDGSDDAVDFSMALAGPSKARKGLSASTKGKRAMMMDDDDDDGDDEEDAAEDEGPATDVEAEEEEIMQMMGKKYTKDGAAVAKATAPGKGKGKETKAVVGGGSWQSMGLAPPLLRSLLMRGYKTPTPIQRASIPSAIATPPRDLVGMARTGSGKTLAYMIPLLQRLSGKHSTKFGARALILCPGRELAVQILRVGKEMARGFRGNKHGGHAGDNDSDEDDDQDMARKGADLRWGLVVGGEGLDEQFSMIASNPDVIIATPGRLLHLIVEMNLDLRSVEYVVFDEADRLFEMGFEVQLHEILHRLPPSRQSMLFSATLPKTLVEFAKAGLVNPKLIRLDAESKISSDLRMAFFSVKPAEKEAALLTLLKEVIKVPQRHDAGRFEDEDEDAQGSDGERRGKSRGNGKFNKKFKPFPAQTAAHQALIFVATKHHVEYLTTMLQTAGFSTSHIYGSLDQTARKQQMDRFRRGRTDLLVVTDVAARGIDIPVLENVINYDFPTGARVFVHRVGRTARAGRKGWAWSLVTNPELPYLLDLHLFLGRPLVSSKNNQNADDTEQLLLGCMPRDQLDAETEYINTTLTEAAPNLTILKTVTKKGQAMYERSQGKASQESYRRAKAMTKDASWGLAGSSLEAGAIHPVFQETVTAVKPRQAGAAPLMQDSAELAEARANLLAKVNAFQPLETVFEVGTRGKTAGAELMKERRKTIADFNSKKQISAKRADEEMFDGLVPKRKENDNGMDIDSEDEDGEGLHPMSDVEMADDEDLEAVFEMPKAKKAADGNYRDQQFYMSHYQSGAAADRGYSLKDGQSFVEQARNATLDLNGDDGIVTRATRPSQLTWDRKKKRFIQGDGVGADNKKLVKTESGARLPASFKSGRFDEWKAKKKIRLPKVGEAEGDAGARAGYSGADKKYRNSKVVEAKPLDPKSTTYEKKLYAQKKRAERLGEPVDGGSGKGGRGTKSELRSVEDIRRQRKIQEQRRAKNARPSKKGGKGGKGKRR